MQAKNGSVKQNQLPPHNIEAEEAFIGSLLIDPDAIIRAVDTIQPQDFFISKHRLVYETILHLFRQHRPWDMVSLNDELERRGQLANIGGPAVITDLANQTPTSMHVEHYAGIIERTAIARRIIEAAARMAQAAYEDNDTDVITEKAHQLLIDATERGGSQPAKSLKQLIDENYDKQERLLAEPSEVVGIPTGIKDLDRIIGGLKRGKMYTVAGRPGMGKSALATSIAHKSALKHGKRVGIFSLEMAGEELVERIIAAQSGLDSKVIAEGRIGDSWSKYVSATSTLGDCLIYVDDSGSLSAIQLRAKAMKLKAQYDIDLIIVDYLQLMSGDRKSQNREQEVATISRSIKQLARDLHIPIIALAQLNRSLESRSDKRPMLSDLRESGAIEQDSDVVLFMYRDEEYNPATKFPNIAELIVAKHRGGPTGNCKAFFKKTQAEFVDAAIERKAGGDW